MDKIIQPQKRNKKRALQFLWVLLLMVSIGTGLYFFREKFRPKASASKIVFTTVQNGDIENKLSATGVVIPSSELLLTSSISSKLKSVAVKDGQKVTTNKLLMSLDTEFAQLEYSKLQDELKVKENNVERLTLNLEKKIRDIEIDHQIKDIEIQTLNGQLIDAKRLQEIGGGTIEDIERVQQAIKISKLEKKKLVNELNYRKASLKSDVRNEELQSYSTENLK